jgi:hypothetical protein
VDERGFEFAAPKGSSMTRLTLVILALGATAPWISSAQKGTAPEGFYPGNYHGDTFSGEVIKVDDAKTLTLQYTQGKKTETFVGTIEAPCKGPTKANSHEFKELSLSSIPAGTVLTAFYNLEKKKEGDTKKIENVILAIRFDKLNGQALTNPGRPVIACSKRGPVTAF